MFRHPQFLHQRDVHLVAVHENVSRALETDCQESQSNIKIDFDDDLFFFLFFVGNDCRPTPQVKHYHIKQNSKLEFFLSEKHCCLSIAELVNYHR